MSNPVELFEQMRYLQEQIRTAQKKMSLPRVVGWLPKNYVPYINPQHFPPDPAYPIPNDNQLSIFPTDQYGNLQPETATEMEVPCPRCGHRAAPEHIVRMTSKRGYKCKCWNCELTWEHNE